VCGDVAAYIGSVLVGVCTSHCSEVLLNGATYTHQQGPNNIWSHITTHRCVL